MPSPELKMLLEEFFGGPVSDEQAMAFKEAVAACGEEGYEEDEGMGPPPGRGKGVDLAIIMGGPKKKK